MLKQRLHILCREFVERRIASAEEAVRQSQAAANEETRSSAGDKYETGRAMAQLDMEKNSVQLAEAQKMKQALLQIRDDMETLVVQAGSLVLTEHENFFIAIPAGKLLVDDMTYFAVSPASPIAMSMRAKKAGESFVFNNKHYRINHVG